MKDDLGDKARELKVSQMTAERLQEELQLRQAELDKIATLDAKIAVELKSLSERKAVMAVSVGQLSKVCCEGESSHSECRRSSSFFPTFLASRAQLRLHAIASSSCARTTHAVETCLGNRFRFTALSLSGAW